jgi:predicted nucleic acid-binding protein
MRQRIYIDTSVVGGYFDEEFKDSTQRLFKRLEDNEVKFVISDLLELELIQAPKHVSELLLKYPTDKFERIELTQETVDLADKYISEKVDVLASWNFKHIVNLDRIKGYNSVNLKLGYPTIEIRTPQELVSYGD